MWKYRCEVCNCFLDPGEGRVCEECREKKKIQPRVRLNLERDGQYRIDLKAAYARA